MGQCYVSRIRHVERAQCYAVTGRGQPWLLLAYEIGLALNNKSKANDPEARSKTCGTKALNNCKMSGFIYGLLDGAFSCPKSTGEESS